MSRLILIFILSALTVLIYILGVWSYEYITTGVGLHPALYAISIFITATYAWICIRVEREWCKGASSDYATEKAFDITNHIYK